MANLKEIQDRTNSIKSTMKITNAMYMISSSKMKRAKDFLAATEPYFYGMQTAVGRILRHIPDLENQYFDARRGIDKKERREGYIVITADKGLAGAYNKNLLKVAFELMESTKSNRESLFVVGEYGRQYFTKKGYSIDGAFRYTVQNPTMHRARVIAERILELYCARELDDVYLIFTKMVSPMQAEPEIMQLLPLKGNHFIDADKTAGVLQEDIEFYPSPDKVLNSTVPNYITGIIYAALVESYCSEQNSRMLAMQAATDNAQEVLRELSIIYNRLRQAAITQEITEVISGAKAQKKKKKQKGIV